MSKGSIYNPNIINKNRTTYTTTVTHLRTLYHIEFSIFCLCVGSLFFVLALCFLLYAPVRLYAIGSLSSSKHSIVRLYAYNGRNRATYRLQYSYFQYFMVHHTNIKKTLTYSWYISVFCGWFEKSGAGGSRTLVQTRNTHAFYMLILLLIFESCKETNTLNMTLSPKVSLCVRSFHIAILNLMSTSDPDRNQEGPSARCLVHLPCKWIKQRSTVLRSSSESVSIFAN